jgi:dual-specificity kinase
MVFDKLGPSLFDFIKRNHYRGFPAPHVQAFGRQILESIAYMTDVTLVSFRVAK